MEICNIIANELKVRAKSYLDSPVGNLKHLFQLTYTKVWFSFVKNN